MQRERGHYWCFKYGWAIHFYGENGTREIGWIEHGEHGEVMPDHYFEQINETRLLPPDEWI